MKRKPAKSFQELIVWQKAHNLVLMIYRLSGTFPQKEIYGITSQMRRAAVSVPANIAEGFKKRSHADKARFINIAQGSLEECRYHLILSKDLGFGDCQDIISKLEEVSKLLNSYYKSTLNSDS